MIWIIENCEFIIPGHMPGYNKHIKLFFNEETHLCQECVDLRFH